MIDHIILSKYEAWSNVLSGGGTEQEKYNVGNDMGAFLRGVVAGAGMKKLVEVIKVVKAEKQLVKVVEAPNEAKGACKPSTRGIKIYEKVENIYSKKQKGEIPYIGDKNIKDKYRPEGSSNPDVRYRKNANKPKIVYDVKTEKSGMSKRQLDAYKANMPKGTKIKTVMKNKQGKYKVKTVGRAG